MRTVLIVLALALAACAGPVLESEPDPVLSPRPESTMDLGAFSVSLTVKDLAASRAFYEKLGFDARGGVPEQNWLIMSNGSHVIGLFQGMFPKNMLTFNPGWNQDAENVDGGFLDVRDIQARLEEAGVDLTMRADPDSDGVAHIMLEDPDGNPILIDQHRPRD